MTEAKMDSAVDADKNSQICLIFFPIRYHITGYRLSIVLDIHTFQQKNARLIE